MCGRNRRSSDLPSQEMQKILMDEAMTWASQWAAQVIASSIHFFCRRVTNKWLKFNTTFIWMLDAFVLLHWPYCFTPSPTWRLEAALLFGISTQCRLHHKIYMDTVRSSLPRSDDTLVFLVCTVQKSSRKGFIYEVTLCVCITKRQWAATFFETSP